MKNTSNIVQLPTATSKKSLDQAKKWVQKQMT